MPPRVLLLSTPFDARSHLDGSRLAVRDLVAGLVQTGVAEPSVLVAPGGVAPDGAKTVAVGAASLPRAIEVAAATALADVDVVHAWFAPRIATAVALRAIRAVRNVRIVQTVASVPRSLRGVSYALPGDVIVPTSDATAVALATHGVDAKRMIRIPAPFAPEAEIPKLERAPRDLLLFVGDLEFDDAADRTLTAFARMAPPRGVVPRLAIASRQKTEAARAIEARLRKRVEETVALRGRVEILGEQPSLLPWIAAARGVLLPASTTYAKLDHPRALLEAVALSVRVVVGTAPSLAELVDDPRIGEVARDAAELRDAMERCFELPKPDAGAVLRLLAKRSPALVAERYARLYAFTSRSP